MKSKMLAFVAFLVALAGTLVAQSQPDRPKPDQAKNDPLFFVKIAADVTGNVQHETLAGSVGMYISEQNWATGLKDSDLAPFLKVKEAKAGRSAACLFAPNKDRAVCVYFDGDSPFGMAAVKAGANGKIEAGDVNAAYKAISKDILKKGADQVTFAPTDLNTDDGQPLPAFIVTAGAAKPNII